MKGLSLWNPWASLIRYRAKHIETRPWNTTYRGPVLICSTAMTPAKMRKVKPGSEFHRALLLDGLGIFADPKHKFLDGHALAVAWIIDTMPMPIGAQPWLGTVQNYKPPLVPMAVHPCHESDIASQQIPPQGWERYYGDYSPGRWSLLLHDIRPLPIPFKISGGQRLWNVHDFARGLVESQLGGPLVMSPAKWVSR